MTHATNEIHNSERLRRQQILRYLLLVCGGITLLLLILLIAFSGGVNARNTVMVGTLTCLIGVIGLSWILDRLGQGIAASHMLFFALVLGATATSLPVGIDSPTLPVYFLPIVGAIVLLRPRWSFGYALIVFAAYMVVLLAGPDWPTLSLSNRVFYILLYAAYFGITALLAALAAVGYERRLTESLRQASELEHARAELEQRVEARTRDVRMAMEDLQRSAETIQQLSVPVVPVAEGVLALPLVGALDTRRADLLGQTLLEAVHRQHAHTVLIDITGVPVVDTQVAAALLRSTQAVTMLGAEPVLVGIRAEVAHTIVGLGIDLRSIVTQRDLQSGLTYALNRVNGLNKN